MTKFSSNTDVRPLAAAARCRYDAYETPMWGTLWARHRIRNPWCEIMLHKCTTAYVRGCVGLWAARLRETGYTGRLRTRNSCNTQHGARDRGVHRPPKSTKPSHSQARHDCRRANKRANSRLTRAATRARPAPARPPRHTGGPSTATRADRYFVVTQSQVGVGESIYYGFTHYPHHLILDSVRSLLLVRCVCYCISYGV